MRQNQNIKVIGVDNKDIHKRLVTFEKSWFFTGETVVDTDDPDHDITLLELEEGTEATFQYLGTAEVEELYKLNLKNEI